MMRPDAPSTVKWALTRRVLLGPKVAKRPANVVAAECRTMLVGGLHQPREYHGDSAHSMLGIRLDVFRSHAQSFYVIP